MDAVEIYTDGTLSCLERLLYIVEINEPLQKISHISVCVYIYVYIVWDKGSCQSLCSGPSIAFGYQM